MNNNNMNNIIINQNNINNNDDIQKKEEKIIQILKDAQYKLSDFGLSKLKGEIVAKNLAGSPLYMAPELFNPAASIKTIENFQVDIWALGVMAFEMFYGRRPFEAYTIEQLSNMYKKGEYYININKDISKDFLSFLNICLQKDPKNRADVEKLLGSNFYNNADECSKKLNKEELLELFGSSAVIEEKNSDHLILRIDKYYFDNEE